MLFLESLNDIKDAITVAEKGVSGLPAHFQEAASDDLTEMRKILVQLGAAIEKEISDEQVNKQIMSEVYRKMQQNELYRKLSAEELKNIAEIVLESSDKELLDLDELSAFYVKMLRKLSPSDFVDFLYNKKEILDFGRNLVPKEMPDEVAYHAGIEVLESNAKLPVKREEMLQIAARDFKKEAALQLDVLRNYYGI